MAVPAVWRLINVLAFTEPKQHAEAHRRDACAPLLKSKSKLLLISESVDLSIMQVSTRQPARELHQALLNALRSTKAVHHAWENPARLPWLR